MVRLLALCLPMAALFVACGSDNSNATLPEGGFDAVRAMADIQHLTTEIGARPSGSDAARAAADYIAEQFGEARFGVFRANYTYEIDPNRPATVTVSGEAIAAVTAGGSKAGAATASAIDVGAADGIAPNSIRGRIAIASRGGSTFREKYEAARIGGAAALVILNAEPGELVANLGRDVEFPVVTVSGDPAAKVAAAAQLESQLTIAVPPPQLGTGTNLVARSPTAHSCVFLMMANYDSATGSPGANDDASGVAIMLELARQFIRLDKSKVPAVCFAAMDGGFSGGTGASSYASSLTPLSQPAAVIDLHAAGAGGPIAVFGETNLVADVREIAAQFGIQLETTTAAPGDLDSFTGPGVSTLQISRSGAETASTIDPEKLREAGVLAGELMTRLGKITRR